MGYYANLDYSNAMISKADGPAAMEAVYAMNDAADHLKSGGAFSGGKEISRHFSWMPVNLREIPSIEELLLRLGFEIADEDGNIYIERYDSKVGQEELFMFAIAPFVKASDKSDFVGTDHASMEWTGEDGSKWRWEFKEGGLFVSEAVINWSGPYRARYDWEDKIRTVATE